MAPDLPKPILYVVINNHFDLTWRRCWQRPFTFKGKTFISYIDLETYYMLDNLALAQQYPDYKFEAESVQVVRKFLERCPEELPRLQQLSREGRFAITGGGEAIIDANMVHGESLVRNYVDGLLWVEETFGQKTRLAVRNDAFGNSAQLPQILRGCEIDWATGMSYSPAEGLYWRGLDGSTILHQTLPVVAQGGGIVKYPPCQACSGSGHMNGAPCPECRGRGISPQIVSDLPEELDRQALEGFGAGLVKLAPEELLPNPALPKWVEAMRAEYDVRFALEEDALPHLQPWLEAVDRPAEDCLHPSLELNPNNSGVLVTRIETKQVVRRQEQAVLALEALSAMSALCGSVYAKDGLKCIRQQQYFTQFHDAITATHVDAAYEELKDIYTEIDRDVEQMRGAVLANLINPAESGVFSVINPTGQVVSGLCRVSLPAASTRIEVEDEAGHSARIITARQVEAGTVEAELLVENLPAFAARAYRVLPSAQDASQGEPLNSAVIENGRFRVQADEHGLVSIFDKALGRDVAVSEAYRPGELVLEHDEGSPWATLGSDQSRIALADCTRLVSARKGAHAQELVFAVETPWNMAFSSKCLSARVTVRLTESIDRVEFQVQADWDSFNHRLRVAMPVPSAGAALHIYEIPYGMIERQPYAPSFRWAGANGDWPAIQWAGVEQDGLSVALLNKGTPSYRMETGESGAVETIFLSLLRSPAIPTYLHEPYFYTMTDYDGMRDAGSHYFEYALCAYAQPFADSRVVLDGDSYNAALLSAPGRASLPDMPVVESPAARVTAVKWAEAGGGLVLRLVEFRGRGGEVTVRLPWGVRLAEKTNLLERQGEELPVFEGRVRLNLRPWEIATLKLTLE